MTHTVCVNFVTFESQECSVLVARVRLDDRGIVVRFLARAGGFSPHSFQADPDSMHLVYCVRNVVAHGDTREGK